LTTRALFRVFDMNTEDKNSLRCSLKCSKSSNVIDRLHEHWALVHNNQLRSYGLGRHNNHQLLLQHTVQSKATTKALNQQQAVEIKAFIKYVHFLILTARNKNKA
jgi:hypothetical protein